MTYDPENPKTSPYSILSSLAVAKIQKIEDEVFLEHLLPIPRLVTFYGTDKNNQRLGYGATILGAFNTRVKDPIVDYCTHGQACFFKPYTSVINAMSSFGQIITPVLLVLSAVGLIGGLYTYIPFICLPGIIELIIGLVGLGQSLFYKIRANTHNSAEDNARAGEYFQDAITRILLAVPLALMSALATPFEFVRFFTRSIATLVHLSKKEPEAQKEQNIAAPQ